MQATHDHASMKPEHLTGRISRRTVLRAGMLGISGAFGASLLQACSSASPAASSGTSSVVGAAQPTSAAANAFAYPSYVPFHGPKPDLPGTPQGVSDAYFRYPGNLVKTVTSPPGSGDDVSFFVAPPGGLYPPSVDQNPAWQEVNKQLNINFKLDLVGTSQDSAAKLGTMVAGGQLTDVLFLGPVTVASLGSMADFLEAKCADLTPYLGGDAVKAYPNLANYPASAWKGPGVVFNNKIFTVPVVHSLAMSLLQVRQDLADQAGVGPINSADDFKRALQAATRPNDNVWGIADQNFILTPYLAAQIFGAPNNWGSNASGQLIKDFETEQFKAGLGWLRDLWSAGVFHPNTPTYNNVSALSDFRAGRFAYYNYLEDALYNWGALFRVNPNARLGVVPPFSQDGNAKAQYFLGPGNFGGSVLNKASPQRIQELLGVMNFFGAPFGSQESLLLTYGIPGTDFNFDAQGNPIAVPDGFASHPVPWQLMTHGPAVIYNPVKPSEFATLVHGAEEATIPIGVQDVTLGLYSSSNAKLGAPLRQRMADGIADSITGRQPLSNWDQLVQDWQNKGGNQIRAEYQQALSARPPG